MKRPGHGLALAVWMALGLASAVLAQPEVQVNGLFKGAAVLTIDGRQQMLREGASSGGVKLISADTQKAVVEVGGKRHELKLSQQISGSYQTAQRQEISIPSIDNQFITQARINGVNIQVLVDTGATSVALNSADARRLGIDYAKGQRGYATTASGTAPMYNVVLRSVEVGGIVVSGVEAGVIEGDFPVTPLLGMSYLHHVEMRNENGVLYLRSKY